MSMFIKKTWGIFTDSSYVTAQSSLFIYLYPPVSTEWSAIDHLNPDTISLYMQLLYYFTT